MKGKIFLGNYCSLPMDDTGKISLRTFDRAIKNYEVFEYFKIEEEPDFSWDTLMVISTM